MNKIWTLYSTEMWEKFNFYGMRALFSLFMVHFLGIGEADAAIYYGAFLALSYLTPIAGGALADRYLGYRRSVILGCVLLCASQALFFFAALENSAFSRALTLAGALATMAGNGFFKPSITALLSASIDDKSKFDAVFSNYYFFLNLGVLLGVFIVPFFGDSVSGGVRDLGAFKWGFLCAFIAMALGLLIFLVFSKRELAPAKNDKIAEEGERICAQSVKFNARNFAISAVIFLLVFVCISYFSSGANFIKRYVYPLIYAAAAAPLAYVFMDESLTAQERRGVGTIFTSAVFIIFFWATFEQAGSSLTFIANNQTDLKILGFSLPASAVSMFNPLFVLILSLPFSLLWAWCASKNLWQNSLQKQAAGLVLMGASYALIAYGVRDLGSNLISIWWFVGLYFVQTCAEMMISPIGFALVGRLSPARFMGLIFGIFYLANAAGYALAGTLGALMPPTADKFAKASELGIDLNAILQGGITPSAATLEILTANKLPSAYPSLFGFEIINLYDFFMMFCVMCAGAGALLFAITKFWDDKA